MSQNEKEEGRPQAQPADARAAVVNSAMRTAGIAAVVFVIGVVVGFPLTTFGVEFVTNNAGVVFGILFIFLVLALLVTGVVVIFRRPLWERLFRHGEIEMERFAGPLSNVARFAALQQVAEATQSARDLAELVLARYAWVSTRRWLMATITAFIAAIAALAGSALLFQQNQLLRTQIGLMEDQNARIGEQNRYIAAQIELGEAQRSTSIVPEILEIGALVGSEVELLRNGGNLQPRISDLSAALRARILAATAAARPYRYLRTPLQALDDQTIMSSGLVRRTDLSISAKVRSGLEAAGSEAQFIGEQRGVLSDRPVSPERGQIVAILLGSGLIDFTDLGEFDLSFAEVRSAQQEPVMFGFSNLRFADFSFQTLVGWDFDGSYLEHARFRDARISGARFSTLLMSSGAGQEELQRGAELAGTDFTGARLNDVVFAGSRGFGIFFDNAVLHEIDFTGADLTGSTFRGSIFGAVDFAGAGLKSVDFSGAVVFDPDFLGKIAAEAAPESFDPTRFTLEPITPDQFAEHPRWADAWLDGIEDRQAYRVVQVKPFA